MPSGAWRVSILTKVGQLRGDQNPDPVNFGFVLKVTGFLDLDGVGGRGGRKLAAPFATGKDKVFEAGGETGPDRVFGGRWHGYCHYLAS